MRSIVPRIKSKISSTAASGNRDKLGMSATASSTNVSVTTKFIKAATSAPCNSSSSPSSVSFRNVDKALKVVKTQQEHLRRTDLQYRLHGVRGGGKRRRLVRLATTDTSQWVLTLASCRVRPRFLDDPFLDWTWN